MPQIFNNAVMTNEGIMLLNKAVAGESKIEITRMAAGSGIYATDEKTVNALQQAHSLKTEEQSVAISSLKIQDKTSVIATAVFSNNTLSIDYHLNEIGLFAKERDVEGSEILYSIAVISEDEGELMPAYNGKNIIQIIQKWAVKVFNAEDVTISLPPDDVYALVEDMGQLNVLKTNHKDNLVEAINEIKDDTDNKANKDGDTSNMVATFTQASKRENITSKEKISIILGKIAKWFVDLKTVAFTGSYNDLSNKPTSLPASDVPAWAKETTKPTYTKSEIGLGNVPNVSTNDQTPTFTVATNRENISSGEKLSVILGKAMKWFTDLKTVAFTGSYNDLSNKPTVVSKTENGLTPQLPNETTTKKYLRQDGTWAVPPDTNTTYSAATATPKANGTANVGTSTKYAREDHVHPLQTSVSGSSGSCTGNAATATKATQDKNGNDIVNTYAKKSLYDDTTVNVGRKPGSEVGYHSFCLAPLDRGIASGSASAVLGGRYNTASGNSSAVIGGGDGVGWDSGQNSGNTASGDNSVVIGGSNNVASGMDSVVIGGIENEALSFQAVTGHYNDTTKATAGSFSGTGTGTAICIGNGTNTSRSNAARIDYNGKLWCKSAYSSTGADYAELFEWEDGNPENEDRRGYFVTMVGDKICKAESGDWILGIVSANPCVLGNTDTEWQGQFLKDGFGAYLTEEFTETQTRTGYVPEVDKDGNPVLDENGEQRVVSKKYEEEITGTRYVLNPDYDPDMEYTDRLNRPEWDAVGMMGVLSVYDDGTCQINGFCSCNDGGMATNSNDGYRVISRVTDNIVKIVFR